MRSSLAIAVVASACSLVPVSNPPPPRYGTPASTPRATSTSSSSVAVVSATTPEGKPLGWKSGFDENVYGPDMNLRKTFVSTRASAAALNGLPGMACYPSEEKIARENGLVGPCWDPPGGTATLPAAHLQPGMRQIRHPSFASNEPTAIYWFDIPREAVASEYGVAMLPSYDRDRPAEYEPYAMQGFARPPLPDVKGQPLAEALAAFDALDLPFIVAVRWSSLCEGANDTVCEVGFDDSPGSAYVRMTLAMRIRFRGTDREEREVPGGLENKPTDEVLATLEQIGFTNVVVVETDLPCARGIACSVPPARFYRTAERLEIQVRRGRATR
ncbi:MAG: hypothetical protein AB7T06_18980 [Kofleriaceae bacterium]